MAVNGVHVCVCLCPTERHIWHSLCKVGFCSISWTHLLRCACISWVFHVRWYATWPRKKYKRNHTQLYDTQQLLHRLYSSSKKNKLDWKSQVVYCRKACLRNSIQSWHFLSRPEPFMMWLASTFLTNSTYIAASGIWTGNLWIASPPL